MPLVKTLIKRLNLKFVAEYDQSNLPVSYSTGINDYVRFASFYALFNTPQSTLHYCRRTYVPCINSFIEMYPSLELGKVVFFLKEIYALRFVTTIDNLAQFLNCQKTLKDLVIEGDIYYCMPGFKQIGNKDELYELLTLRKDNDYRFDYLVDRIEVIHVKFT